MAWRVVRDEEGWIVVDDTGRIANGHAHKTRVQAERHAAVLSAFHCAWGMRDNDEKKNRQHE